MKGKIVSRKLYLCVAFFFYSHSFLYIQRAEQHALTTLFTLCTTPSEGTI